MVFVTKEFHMWKGGRKAFDIRRFHNCCNGDSHCYKEWKMESVGHKEDSQQLHRE